MKKNKAEWGSGKCLWGGGVEVFFFFFLITAVWKGLPLIQSHESRALKKVSEWCTQISEARAFPAEGKIGVKTLRWGIERQVWLVWSGGGEITASDQFMSSLQAIARHETGLWEAGSRGGTWCAFHMTGYCRSCVETDYRMRGAGGGS